MYAADTYGMAKTEVNITPKMRKDAKTLAYLKDLEAGKLTLTQAARMCGFSIQWMIKLRRKYQQYGASCLEHGNKNRIPHNKISIKLEQKILLLYTKDEYKDLNFATFRECLEDYENIKISYKTIQRIMQRAGIKSPESHKIKKKDKVHRIRPRREHRGELIQIDGTPYEFFQKFGDWHKYCMHGAVDDATSEITAMYMTENECLYGVLELFKQMEIRYDGLPCEAYMDRAAWACVTPRHKKELTLVEQLAGVHEKRTQLQRVLSELNINQILAWSPQAKGRVERMWQTVQNKYPIWAYKHGIKTIDDANKHMNEFIDWYNSRYAKKPKSDQDVWHEAPLDFDDIMYAQFPRKTNRNGQFKFHSYDFAVIDCPRVANRDFTLCISSDGIYARMSDNKYYNVQLLDDDLGYVVSDTMSGVVKDIIYKNLFAFAKEVSA